MMIQKKPNNIDSGKLLDIVERVENLTNDAKAIAEDIKQVFEEAKSAGYDPKYIKKCIALRAKGPDEVEEEDELMAMYRNALNI
jgi:uncharacterized protein (UPF0335 family)